MVGMRKSNHVFTKVVTTKVVTVDNVLKLDLTSLTK